jgi:hypothetical protein
VNLSPLWRKRANAPRSSAVRFGACAKNSRWQFERISKINQPPDVFHDTWSTACSNSLIRNGTKSTIRTTDSFQEGVVRFLCRDPQRLGPIVKLVGKGISLVFLFDEVFRALVQRGALGLMTTQDRALTRIVEKLELSG